MCAPHAGAHHTESAHTLLKDNLKSHLDNGALVSPWNQLANKNAFYNRQCPERASAMIDTVDG